MGGRWVGEETENKDHKVLHNCHSQCDQYKFKSATHSLCSLLGNVEHCVECRTCAAICTMD